MTAILVEKAPAKINLSLHIRSRRADGYHEIDSFVAFAGFGDFLTMEVGRPISLIVEGAGAAACGPVANNLALRAAQALAAEQPSLQTGAMRLVKRLPAAAGLGGGSSDAAAVLRLIARANDLSIDHPAILRVARGLGADVPVCLAARARTMRGIGEILEPIVALPRAFAVLVNPRRALATADVFAALELAAGASFSATTVSAQPDLADAESFAQSLKTLRNDLEGPACALEPTVGEVLEVLERLQGARVARMSGSGATCFAIFVERRAAVRAARLIETSHPDWWTRATILR